MYVFCKHRMLHLWQQFWISNNLHMQKYRKFSDLQGIKVNDIYHNFWSRSLKTCRDLMYWRGFSLWQWTYLFLQNLHLVLWHLWWVEFFNEVNFDPRQTFFALTDLDVLPHVHLFRRSGNFTSRGRNEYVLHQFSFQLNSEFMRVWIGSIEKYDIPALLSLFIITHRHSGYYPILEAFLHKTQYRQVDSRPLRLSLLSKTHFSNIFLRHKGDVSNQINHLSTDDIWPIMQFAKNSPKFHPNSSLFVTWYTLRVKFWIMYHISFVWNKNLIVFWGICVIFQVFPFTKLNFHWIHMLWNHLFALPAKWRLPECGRSVI